MGVNKNGKPTMNVQTLTSQINDLGHIGIGERLVYTERVDRFKSFTAHHFFLKCADIWAVIASFGGAICRAALTHGGDREPT